MKLTLKLFAILIALIFAGCTHPRLSKSEAIRIARHAAKVHGDLYEPPVARYWLVPEKRCWEVYFRLPMPCADFSVLVDDRTGEAKVRTRGSSLLLPLIETTGPLNEAQAGLAVTNFAREKKIKFDGYQKDIVSFHRDTGSWAFVYWPTGSAGPGDQLYFEVDSTGKVIHHPGE